MDGSAYTARVREEFDRLADLPESGGWDHNAYYHSFLLKQLPPCLDEALEVGRLGGSRGLPDARALGLLSIVGLGRWQKLDPAFRWSREESRA